ncbi:MAG: glycosyltransferase family 2 protein [Stellaceae bacterium]
MELSIVIPVRNEAGNITPLVAEIVAALDPAGVDYEVVYVDDGSTDATAAEISHLQTTNKRLRIVSHAKSCGQSAAVRTGVRAARAAWIATLDGDGQNDPADIPSLWQIAKAAPPQPALLIAGHRAQRRDIWSKRRASKIANAIRRAMLHDATPDTGCGLKLFPRALFLDLPYFDHMHRFLPALVLREGGVVRSLSVNHRSRERGASKYGVFDRLWVGIADLFGVMWLCRRNSLPVVIGEQPRTEAQPERRRADPVL